MLAFVIWQFLPLVIVLLNAAGKTNHNWHVGSMQEHPLNAGCLLVTRWQRVPFGAIVTTLFIWYFIPSVIRSVEDSASLTCWCYIYRLRIVIVST